VRADAPVANASRTTMPASATFIAPRGRGIAPTDRVA
jgi:hypothetical protein